MAAIQLTAEQVGRPMTFFGSPEAAKQFIADRKKRMDEELRSASSLNTFNQPNSAVDTVANRRSPQVGLPSGQVTPESASRELKRENRREVNDLIQKRDQLTKEGFTGIDGKGGLAELAQMQIDRKTGVPVGTHTALSQGAKPIADDATRMEREARRAEDRGDRSGAAALERGAAQERLRDQKEKQVRSDTRVDSAMKDIERRRDKAIQDKTKELGKEAKDAKMNEKKRQRKNEDARGSKPDSRGRDRSRRDARKQGRADKVAARRDGGKKRRNRKSKK